ncbi:hypothetical protein [Methylocystis rosea]|uniref:hypothetical protein n=1 Tax=Methylocystis rosea TaxID=173366 RepID=UPI003D2F483C
MIVEQEDRRGALLGRVTAVHGSVIDVRFASGALPAINEAVAIEWDRGDPIIAEVQKHLDAHTVRAVALSNTAGLNRGVPRAPWGSRSACPWEKPYWGGCSIRSATPQTEGRRFLPT